MVEIALSRVKTRFLSLQNICRIFDFLRPQSTIEPEENIIIKRIL